MKPRVITNSAELNEELNKEQVNIISYYKNQSGHSETKATKETGTKHRKQENRNSRISK